MHSIPLRNYIFLRLYLTLVERRPLQDQICQDDIDHTGRDRSELNAPKGDNEGRKQQ
jgi:hypothetical protein